MNLKRKTLFDAAMTAARERFRPILMTAFSFILGVFPLVVASGSGAEARKVMGMALLGGMTLATFLGVFLYPMLFVAVGKLFSYEKKRDQLQQKDLVMADEIKSLKNNKK
jgi:HAE1 family hydrophobic/amphiphilic exporter-1